MKEFEPISISEYGSFSVLGTQDNEIFNHYLTDNHFFNTFEGNLCSPIQFSNKDIITHLNESKPHYIKLDRSVLLALKSAENLFEKLNWKTTDAIGINIASSRGATHLWEKYITEFNKHNKVSTLVSPTTSLGNISSWVANHLKIQGPNFSHSMTCSGSFYAILNACAWINSGMIEKMIVGGSEAAITQFTIEQFKALRIYSNSNEKYPCLAGNFEKKINTMIIGEGGMLLGLEKKSSPNSIKIKSIGYASEMIHHPVSLSREAENCQKAMQLAKKDYEIDIIITHTPGTIKGDLAEFEAIKKVFGKNIPLLTNNKWKLGHTFGASGVLSLEMALLMLKKQQFFSTFDNENPKMKIENILINTMGFGGNAVSILVGI